MALKDWKITYKVKDYTIYRNPTGTGVKISSYKPEKYGYTVKIASNMNYPLYYKSFKSKPKAIAYAKAYMKKH